MLNKAALDIECNIVCQKIEDFIQTMVVNSKTNGVVLGLSGGIDSAVAAALAVRALGKDRVLGLILPTANLEQHYENDARILAKQLGMMVKRVSIDDFVNAFKDNVDEEIANNCLAIGNAMARFRMVMLYGYANHMNYLVLGTSNKTEIMVGYLTKYGDGGIDFEPCGELYKTQIRILANYLNIPQAIIEKPPSAGFWKGQTDEGEMGITYELLDFILLGIEKNFAKEKIAKTLMIESSLVEKVENMIKNSEHKRKMPPVLRLQ